MSFCTSGQHHAAAFLDAIHRHLNLRRIQLYTMYHDFVSWLTINGRRHLCTICSGNAQGSSGNEIARSHRVVDSPESSMRKIQCASEQNDSPCERNTRRSLLGQVKNSPCQVQIRRVFRVLNIEINGFLVIPLVRSFLVSQAALSPSY